MKPELEPWYLKVLHGLIYRGAPSLEQSWSADKGKPANIQAQAKNKRERQRAHNLPVSQEGCPEIVFHEIPQVPYKSTLIDPPNNLGLDISWEWVDKSQTFRGYVELAVGSQPCRGKCHVKVKPTVHEQRRSSWFHYRLCFHVCL